MQVILQYLREARECGDERVLRFFGDPVAAAAHVAWVDETGAVLMAEEAARKDCRLRCKL